MITQESIQKINDLPIIDVAQKYLTNPIIKSGVNYATHCIWHSEKNPSLIISPVKNIATCFVCARTTGAVGMVMEVENLNYPEAIKHIANSFKIEIKETYDKKLTNEQLETAKHNESLYIANAWAADFYHNNLLALLDKYASLIDASESELKIETTPSEVFANDEHRELLYILKRYKYSLQLIKKFKIGYAPKGSNNLKSAAVKAGFKQEILIEAGLLKEYNQNSYVGDYFVHRPMIVPIIQGTKIVGFGARKMPWDKQELKPGEKDAPKFINTADTPIYKKSEVMYGADNETQKAIKKADKVYVVEGYTDKSTLTHIGVKNVLAKSGTALTEQNMAKIKRLTNNVCLLDDGDKAGQAAMHRNAETLTMAGYNVTVIPLGAKEDPDSFFTSLEQFTEHEVSNELDYIIDIVATEQLDAANTVQKKQAVQLRIADMLISKPKEERNSYIAEVAKKSGMKKPEVQSLVREAILKKRNQGLNKGDNDADEDESTIKCDQSDDNSWKHDWYQVKLTPKGAPNGLKIDVRRFLNKLKSTKEYVFEADNGRKQTFYFGFYLHSLNADFTDPFFVQLKNGRIKKVSVDTIQKLFLEFVKELKPYRHKIHDKEGIEHEYIATSKKLESLVLENVTNIFNPARLVLYPDTQIKIISDTMFNHYTFFKNCYVVSDKHGYVVHDYEELKEGFVWEDMVLEHEFSAVKDKQPGYYEKFIHDITGNIWDVKTNKPTITDLHRLNAMQISLGYLLHNYTEMQRKVVVYQQGRLSEEDTSEGREGKTFAIKFLGENMLNKVPDQSGTFIAIPGKEIKENDKHKWQNIQPNTTLVLYDDPAKGFNFESMYNIGDSGFLVEPKNQRSFNVKARCAIATNRPIERDSGSSKARSCIIELNSPFSSNYEPGDKYGVWFGRDFDKSEWNRFFEYILGTCLPAYFNNNMKLIETVSKNLNRNELIQKANKLIGTVEIVFWFDFIFRGNAATAPFIQHNTVYTSKELLKKYMDEQTVSDEKRLKRNFSSVLETYLQKNGIEFEKDRDASGSTFKITQQLQSNVVPKEVLEKYFADAFYNADDVNNESDLPNITNDFNALYNYTLTQADMKKLATELLPF